jgi:hypothetical protein
VEARQSESAHRRRVGQPGPLGMVTAVDETLGVEPGSQPE